MRSESSYQRRKQLQQADDVSDNNSPWCDAVSHLDQALDKLPESDRSLLFLHYFENRPFPEIAQTLGKNPAAVQKRSQRALEKLARILRSKGVTLSATVLATGLTSELAKAAPAAFLNTATAAVLTGTATYSTTGLTLMFATKSKALVPLALMLLITPLIFQQVAISRAIQRNESLHIQLVATAPSGERNLGSSKYTVSNRSIPPGRITITTLSRALDDAQRGGPLAWIAFEDMVAGLNIDQLAEFIPGTVALPEAWTKRTDLIAYLIHALAKMDPELAVRTVVRADPRGKLLKSGAGLDAAFAAWADKDLDGALTYFGEIVADPKINPMAEGAIVWSTTLNNLHAALLGSMVAVKSTHIREVLLMAPKATRTMALTNAMDSPSLGLGMTSEIPSYNLDRNLSNFIPLIREFIPEKERAKTLESLLFDLRRHGKDDASKLGKVMDQGDLLPSERLTIAQSYALGEINTRYNTTPPPDPEEVENRTRQWLEQYIPDHADEILNEAKSTAYRHEQFQIKSRIESMADDLEITDAWLIQQLTRKRFGEMLPQALEQAQRIKDPENRRKMLLSAAKFSAQEMEALLGSLHSDSRLTDVPPEKSIEAMLEIFSGTAPAATLEFLQAHRGIAHWDGHFSGAFHSLLMSNPSQGIRWFEEQEARGNPDVQNPEVRRSFLMTFARIDPDKMLARALSPEFASDPDALSRLGIFVASQLTQPSERQRFKFSRTGLG